MIRGATQAFKFTTSYDFEDINNIIATFSQPHNIGTTSAPMPIMKYYNNKFEPVTDEWSETDKDTTKVYKIDTKYGRYDATSTAFVWSTTPPMETDLLGATPITVPTTSADGDISKIYKCGQSYYQYNPSTQKWDITTNAPSTDLIELSQVGVDNIPAATSKKQACVYKDHYYRYNGTTWIPSTDKLLPVEEVDYWDARRESQAVGDKPQYDQTKIYCALATYYKYVNGAWIAYGKECVTPIEVYAFDPTAETNDQSKIYMLKELYYQYNPETDQFEKTGVREVYYRYDTSLDTPAWVECEKPDVDIEELDLWVTGEESLKNPSKTYVCKNVYYSYDTENNQWKGSNNMLIPVIEVNAWDSSNETKYDTSKVYMCPARYYQYNIEEEAWEEVEEVKQPQTINLNYWTDPTDRDKNNIYLCDLTYFQYDSEKEKWVSSASYEMKLTQVNETSEASDHSKIYECTPTYYKYDTEDKEWVSCKNTTEAFRNDGFQPVAGEPKSFVMVLTAEETMRFTDKYKGRAQVTVYSDKTGCPESSKIEYFTVYPTLITEGFGVTATSDTEILRILDAGEVIEE